MPIYEYECSDHGGFELSRPMRESAAVGVCPVCDLPAPRVVSAPNFGVLARSTVRAIERNEKSRHEPRAVRVEPRAGAAEDAPRPRVPVGGRPWMVGHG